MNIIRSIIPILLSIIDMVINNLNGKMDYVEFQKQLANKLNEVAREILRLVLKPVLSKKWSINWRTVWEYFNQWSNGKTGSRYL
jgi:hypothetical protein